MKYHTLIPALTSLVLISPVPGMPAAEVPLVKIAAAQLVNGFGTFLSPDSKRKIVVTRRSVSLVDFQVFDVASGKELANDYVGSDAMRWFLWWETPGRLWGYGSDIGYFKLFEFRADGSVMTTRIKPQMAVPKFVHDNLPSSLKKRYQVAVEK
ncbi:hypothetical protein [Prosthecobacter sp.]|uniref:hypothetical protein n=1 Tax=Prosthecobacter sp. TaxID=1965333 RepID=UPI003784E033